jgi:hypothetical protein
VKAALCDDLFGGEVGELAAVGFGQGGGEFGAEVGDVFRRELFLVSN